jgi:hypothetical protein
MYGHPSSKFFFQSNRWVSPFVTNVTNAWNVECMECMDTHHHGYFFQSKKWVSTLVIALVII